MAVQEQARESIEDLKRKLLSEWRDIAERHGVHVYREPDVIHVFVKEWWRPRRSRDVRLEAYYQGFKVVVVIDENGVEDAWVDVYETECYCECTSG